MMLARSPHRLWTGCDDSIFAALTERQARSVAWRVFQELVRDLPASKPHIRLSNKANAVLMEVSPRRMRQALQEGVGRALMRRSNSVLPCDLVVEQVVTQPERRIGFLP